MPSYSELEIKFFLLSHSCDKIYKHFKIPQKCLILLIRILGHNGGKNDIKFSLYVLSLGKKTRYIKQTKLCTPRSLWRDLYKSQLRSKFVFLVKMSTTVSDNCDTN